MIVDSRLPDTREQLVMIGNDAPADRGRSVLRDRDKDIVVVRDSDRVLAGVITKTDIVRQISRCEAGLHDGSIGRDNSGRRRLPP